MNDCDGRERRDYNARMSAPRPIVPLILLVAMIAGVSAQAPLWRGEAGPGPGPDARASAPRHLDEPQPFTPAFATRAEWEARAARLRTQLQVALGLWPMPEKTPLAPVIRDRIVREGYTVEKVVFASLPGHYVTGNLYRPTGRTGRRPGVLSPHGHWEKGRLLEQPMELAQKTVASGGEQTIEGARYPLQARCAMLARLGAVVFQFDMVGYADSQAITHRQGFLDADAELRLQSFMGLQIWNAIRALDFLESLPDVDPRRLGVTGESGGGTQTFLLSAIDPRPVTAVPAVMVSGNMQGGCICENASLLRLGTNNIELAALFAPKPLGLIGADDWTVDIEQKGLPELKTIYGLFARPSLVDAKHFAFPHNYNQVSREYMYAWFNKHLGLGQPEPIREQPFVPVPPAELAVFDATHPRPAAEAAAPALRQTLTARDGRQMRALASRPAEFRRIVSAALETMVQDRYPVKAEIVPDSFRSVEAEGFSVHHSVLTRPGSAARVPTIGIVPAGYAGKVVVVWLETGGRAAAFEADGRTPIAAIARLLKDGVAVLVPDVFLTGATGPAAARTRVKNEETYAGFNLGYNPSVFANRVSDTLTVIAFAQQRAPAVQLVGVGQAGVWALAARALAGPAVLRAAITVDGFDFNGVTRLDDEMLQPGAVRYGGVLGFASLCEAGHTRVAGLPARPAAPWAPRPPSVAVESASASREELAAWVLRK